MLQILAVTFPFFALVLCGFVAAQRGVLPLAAIPGLNGFVLFFALPCMLYRFGANTPIGELLDMTAALLWLGCALFVVAVALLLARRAGRSWNDSAFGALVAAFPNTGFMGVPLLVALLGARAAGPTILAVAIDMVITTSLCVALSRLDGAGSAGAGAAARRALAGMLVNPLPWAIALGVVASALQFTLPGPIDRTLGLLADAASPVALFTIGAVLARSRVEAAAASKAGHAAAHGRDDALQVAVLKLVLHPLAVWAVTTGAIAAGLPLDPFAALVLVLIAALPSASNVSMLAERYGADNGRVARIILYSTAAAFFTFSGAVAMLR
ncbi:MAG: AEC family transporter [Burkholderiaceae bacterium]|nr:AEC family transporter [Burkholderiaceae bacterium]